MSDDPDVQRHVREIIQELDRRAWIKLRRRAWIKLRNYIDSEIRRLSGDQPISDHQHVKRQVEPTTVTYTDPVSVPIYWDGFNPPQVSWSAWDASSRPCELMGCVVAQPGSHFDEHGLFVAYFSGGTSCTTYQDSEGLLRSAMRGEAEMKWEPAQPPA